ncbi:MAG: GTP cyclohydrolase 1 [bacterium ADurb.Bin236]|nr:MAG: GTP cyclohydrolase 1 [bacterium ADurb.Bin236]HOY62101.1 GTP cyclohydrolase I FolE [bacterium]
MEKKNKKKIEKAIRDILEAIGEDPDRGELVETPARVAAMYEEIFAGMNCDPKEVLKVLPDDFFDEIIMVRDIPIYSMCEHHMLPFFGKAHIAYIPSDGRITGLSKLVRVTHMYSRRLQLQERLTNQIATAINEILQPKGVMVVIEAEHLCMAMRGVREAGTMTVTSSVKGAFRTHQKTRMETLALLRDKK